MEMWKECSIHGLTAMQEECLNSLESGEAKPVVLDMFLTLFLGDSHFPSHITCGPNVDVEC